MVSYPRVFIAAGEHSGDRFGACLAGALKRLLPDVRLSGVGGSLMEAAGVRVVADTVGHAGMGLLQTGQSFWKWARVFRRCVREFNDEAPDVLVPVDNPGFNLRIAGLMQGRGTPVCYYVSPQVWAWLPGRIHRIARAVTRMMVILPFEKAMYDRLGVDCRFVGHPALDYLSRHRLDEAFVTSCRGSGKTVVGLLPGSRLQEVRHTFPIICDAAARIRERLPETAFHVAAASREHVAALRQVLDARGLPAEIHLDRTAEIMKAARVCVVVSGTATLETAFYRTPMVIVYRTNRWARIPARRLLQVKHIGLVNIVAGREVAPEFLKFDDDARPIAESALKLLTDSTAWEESRAGLDEVTHAMGPTNSCQRAAEAVADCLETGNRKNGRQNHR